MENLRCGTFYEKKDDEEDLFSLDRNEGEIFQAFRSGRGKNDAAALRSILLRSLFLGRSKKRDRAEQRKGSDRISLIEFPKPAEAYRDKFLAGKRSADEETDSEAKGARRKCELGPNQFREFLLSLSLSLANEPFLLLLPPILQFYIPFLRLCGNRPGVREGRGKSREPLNEGWDRGKPVCSRETESCCPFHSLDGFAMLRA